MHASSTPSSSMLDPFGDDMFTEGVALLVSQPRPSRLRTSRPGNGAATLASPYSSDDVQDPLPQRAGEFESALGSGVVLSSHTSPTKPSPTRPPRLPSATTPYTSPYPRDDLQQTPRPNSSSNLPSPGYFNTEMAQVGAYAITTTPSLPQKQNRNKKIAAPLPFPPSPSPSPLTSPSSSSSSSPPPLPRPPSSSDLYTDDSKAPPSQHTQQTQHRERKAEEATWHDVDISDDDAWEKVSSLEDTEWEVVAPRRAVDTSLGSLRGVGGGGGREGAREAGTRGVGERGGIWREGGKVTGLGGLDGRGRWWDFQRL